MQEFDYMFADEAHHLVATALDGGLLGDVVKRKNDGKLRVEAKHRVYATATPRQMSKAVIAQAKKHGSKPLDSMGVDSDAFGPEAYRLTFGEAIDLGILTDYQLSIIAVPEDDHAKFINQRAYVDFDHVDGVIDGQTFATVQAIKELYEGGYRRIVTYHTYVKDAIRFAKIIEGMEGLPGSAAVYGSLSATERTRRLDRLKSDEGYVISNVRCLNEGVDIPALDAIVFADPKSSEVDIAQSVGRVLRRAPGKKIGLVVIPVALSSDQWESGEIDQERLESDLDATGPFKTVIDVMLALGDHDDTIRQIIHDMRFGLGKRHNQKGMQADVDADFDDESDLDDVNAFIDGVVGDDGKVDRTMKAPFPNDTSSIFGNGKVTLHAPGMTAEMLERFAQNMRNAVVRRATKTRNTEEDAIINMLIENWEVTTRKAVKLSRRIFHLLASGMPAQEAAMSVSRGLVTKRKAA
jgi:predicted helicase